jgi:hypothetical protein
MTTQQQTIAFSVLGVIAVPLATFITIKLIHKLTRPPMNTLNRSGDIELNDYIEPSNNYPDLLEFPPHIYDRVPSYYTGQAAPSYYSGGNPPSFNTVDRFYIHSTLEDNINLDYIF